MQRHDALPALPCSIQPAPMTMLDPACESCSTKDDRAEAADEIERLRDGASRWIPVTERLPEDTDYGALSCWVTYEFDGSLEVDHAYFDGVWRNPDGERIPIPILAWMGIPKPEAYKP